MEPQAKSKHKATKKGQAEWQTVPTKKRNASNKENPPLSPSMKPLLPGTSSQDTASSDSSGSHTTNSTPGKSERQQSLSPDFLQNVANNIHPKKWRPIFRDLMSSYTGKPPIEVMIGDIEKNHQDDVVEQKYQALQKWQSIMGVAATWEKLKKTLEKNECPYEDEEMHPTPTGSGAVDTPNKDRMVKVQVQVAWDGEELSIHRGTAIDVIPLKGRFEETGQTTDPVTVADAMLVSIINPNQSSMKFGMDLGEVKQRFHEKYREKVSFKDLSVGGIESFVSHRSRVLTLEYDEKQKCMIQEIRKWEKDMHVHIPSDVHLPDSDSETESELTNYDTASELFSPCPSPVPVKGDQAYDMWQLARGSPRNRKSKHHPRKTVSETCIEKVSEKTYFQKKNGEDLQRMTARCEGNQLVFRTEEEYSGENGCKLFTKDVVALWNTPRKGAVDAHIIVGVQPSSSPPHDLIGLKHTNRLNNDYQEMFMTQCFSIKPQFMYQEVEYLGKLFGLVSIHNGAGSGQVCWAEENVPGEWYQSDILYREGNVTKCAATRKEQNAIYSWFHTECSLGTPPKGAAHEDDDKWQEFRKQLDIENHQRRSYGLLVSHCPWQTPELSTLAHFPWVRVWDFDPESRESGLLTVCEAIMQDRLVVRTWKDPPQTSLSSSFTEWFFVRGLKNRDDSLVLGSVRQWINTVGKTLSVDCDQLSKFCENKPLTVVVLWYGGKEYLRHLQRTLFKIDECVSGVNYIICMQHIPEDADSRSVITEICTHLEIPKILEIPLERLCIGLSSLSCCQKRSVAHHMLPGDGMIKSRDSPWLQQELDVLYKGELPAEEPIKHGEAFLKGGELSWQEIDIHVYDAMRTIMSDLIAYLRNRLYKGLSGIVTLFHEPGAGGTTLGRRILWDLHEEFPCACAISDVIDPTEIYHRLEMLYERTHSTILLLVDGQESRLVKELFEMSQNIHIIILSVQRYTLDIRNKTRQGEKFWLRGEVDNKEAVRFSHVFSQTHVCSGETKKKLKEMVEEVQEKSTHYVYEFGLAVYDTEYIGLRSYVEGYLKLQRRVDLANWQRAVGYLALACYYGYPVSIPCQFFSVLFGKKESEVVKADDVLTHSGKQFVLEDSKNCTWKITHHAVAKEILEQMLYGRQNDSKGKQLSMKARRNLKDFAKDFLSYASEKQKCSKFDAHSTMMRILRGIFIHRDYKETGQDEQNKRERLSRLMCDIPSSNTSRDQLEVMEHLVECFPNDPTCVSHLGRARILFTQNYDHAEQDLKRARDLRLKERKANKDKYMYKLPCENTSEADDTEQDSILCTIYHNLGILSHERIKELIGGGKLGDGKKYKCALEDDRILQKVYKHARTAVGHFTNCRRYLSKGMNASYGYIGEIKVRLHVADFVDRCCIPGGYYGFLNDQNIEGELKDFVESCFTCVDSLLREYQDLMSPTEHSEAEELDICQNWFSVIFKDAETALTYWQGKEDVNGNRSKIAVYKLKHQKDIRGKASCRRTPAQTLNNISSADDLKKIVQLYEGIFKDAYNKSIPIDISTDLRDWIVTIRHSLYRPSIYSIAEKVLPQVERCYQISRSSSTALYYLFVLNTTLALLTKQTMYLAESNRLVEKLKKVRSKINRLNRIITWEWLGSDKRDHSIRRLVHRSCLGSWDSEKRFWQDESAQAKLQVCTGVITNCKTALHGHISITTGGLSVGDNNRSLQAVFVPKQCGLFGKNYLNTDVEFYVGFNIEKGIEAYNVLELKKYQCKHCNTTVSVSRLVSQSTKICQKCNHALSIPAES